MKSTVRSLMIAGIGLLPVGGVFALMTRDGGSEEVAAINFMPRQSAETTQPSIPPASSSIQTDDSTPTIEAEIPAVEVTAPVGGLGVVPGLASAKGKLRIRDDDFFIRNREVDFGPDEWLVANTAPADLDGNGEIASWWVEVTGLVGREVEILGDVDDDDIDVFEINDVSLRPLYSEVAPWSDDWQGKEVEGLPAEKLKSGLTADEAVRIALREVPGVVLSAHVDVNDGHPYWELDVRGRDGSLYDVEIDAVTGALIEVDRD